MKGIVCDVLDVTTTLTLFVNPARSVDDPSGFIVRAFDPVANRLGTFNLEQLTERSFTELMSAMPASLRHVLQTAKDIDTCRRGW